MRLALIALLLLYGCDKPPTKDAVDVADVNARNALSKIDAMESRIEQLESNNEALEGQVSELIEADVRHARLIRETMEFQAHVAEKHNELSQAYEGHTHPYR